MQIESNITGADKSLVFLSGYMFGNWVMRRLSAYFSNYNVVLIARVGALDENGNDADLSSTLEQVQSALAALGIGQYYLAGHSMGGFIAQIYAHLYPQEVAGLILLGTCNPIDFLESHRNKSADVLPSLFSLGDNAFFKVTISNLFTKYFMDNADLFRILREDFFGDFPDKSDCYSQLQVMDQINSWFSGNITAINCKVLVLLGEQDQVVPPKWSRLLEKHISQVSIEGISSGHMFMYEQPELTYEAIDRWIN